MKAAAPSRTRRTLACAAVSAALLVGCASSPPKPAQVAGSIVAAPTLNQDVRGRASPVVLRLYELRSAALFESADFVSLYEKDQATLGAELISREELVVRPGETRTIATKSLAADARFVGVVAAYRDLERARWRAVVPMTAGRVNTLSIELGALAVQAGVR